MKLDRLARYAWGVLALNLGVILWGAYVRATGSGAGCGSHWPLCNGDVVPRGAAAETLIEFTHRATSGLALIAVIGLFLWVRRAHPSGSQVRTGAALSLVFIVVEALLGAGLVLFELVAENDSSIRAFSMIAHLVNTFILVAVLSLTAWWASGGAPIRLRGRPAHLPLIAAALLGLIFVGATGAIAALGDTLFPSPSLEQGLRDSFSSESHPLIQLRKYHPLAAILVGLLTVLLARHLARVVASDAVRALAAAVISLYVVQIAAGTVNIVLLAPLSLQLLHLLLAELVWIAMVLLSAATLGATPVRRVDSAATRFVVRS
ncbi:MAG: COX15/CtaA family protein [Gemmatimonadota bacterium]